jgi:hypothetical protein
MGRVVRSRRIFLSHVGGDDIVAVVIGMGQGSLSMSVLLAIICVCRVAPSSATTVGGASLPGGTVQVQVLAVPLRPATASSRLEASRPTRATAAAHPPDVEPAVVTGQVGLGVGLAGAAWALPALVSHPGPAGPGVAPATAGRIPDRGCTEAMSGRSWP